VGQPDRGLYAGGALLRLRTQPCAPAELPWRALGGTCERSEFDGPTFSPDGSTFFVNIQRPGITYAIWGPFKEPSGARQRQMAHADPPMELRPRVSGELSEAAERYVMSELEATAYDRLGVLLT
jgi:secreted PhoX family phosphatase